MDLTSERCICCGSAGMEPAMTMMVREIEPVRVTVEGVPAVRCQTCGEISMEGKFAIPIDAAMRQILIATGVASLPTLEETAALRAENRALARQLGQEDTLLDEPVDVPSGATGAIKP